MSQISFEKTSLTLETSNVPNEKGNFETWDLRKKYIILEESWFTSNEIRILMEKWVCGKDKLTNIWKSLLEDPKFSFLKKQEYKELIELYWWHIDTERLLWEWQNAIILQHPNKWNRVLKVARQWIKDDIIKEFNSHEAFFKTLEKWKIEFPWELSDNIKIPEIKKWSWNNPVYFEMEKIDWQSFKSLFYREKYATQLERLHSKDELLIMSDARLEWIVRELWLDPIPSMIVPFDWWYLKALFKESQEFMWNKIRNPITKQEYELGSVLGFLDWKWLKHTDMHCWNFMLSRDWKTTFIIDFGNTNLNIKK